MAQKGAQLDQETFSCSICLDLLRDPVTVACGHSYCMNCIKTYWDEEGENGSYSCPQCRQAYRPRPVLLKNTMLAVVVEELKKTGLQAAPAEHCYAGPEDVACDFCSGRKLKAYRTCVVCMVSYCDNHLQPHYDVAPLKKHKLMKPSKKLQENLCYCHDEVMKIVSTAAERTEREKELEEGLQEIQQRIQDREKDVNMLQQEVEAINRSADKAVEHSEKTFTQLICLIQKRSSDVKQQLRSQQETVVSRVKDLQEKLEQEITKLKRKDAELKTLSLTEDHNQFLTDYRSLPPLSGATHSSSIDLSPMSFFDDVTTAVSEVRDELQDVLRKTWKNILRTGTEVDVLLSQPDPTTRADFLKYLRKITLDPNTANTELVLSEGNRTATSIQKQPYPDHPDRFTLCRQVLSKESLTGRCYWEVEYYKKQQKICVAVAYKSINRDGYGSGFGHIDSWALDCQTNGYSFVFKKGRFSVLGPLYNKVGVYLDHSAGILSFYSVSETMTLIHRHHTRFTQPLYAGVGFEFWYGQTAEFIQLK